MSAPQKKVQVTIRLTRYEARRLDVIRRHGVPYGARLREAAPAVAQAIVHLANEIEAGRPPGATPPGDGAPSKKT